MSRVSRIKRIYPCNPRERKIYYRTIPMENCLTRIEVTSNFYSNIYGVCVIGINKETLVQRLSDKLAREYGLRYTLTETDKDEADNIGRRKIDRLSVTPRTCGLGVKRRLKALSD